MHFVNRHRPIVPAARGVPDADPVIVAPPEAAVLPDHRRRSRRHFEMAGVRIGLLEQMTGIGAHLELVAGPGGQLRNEQLPYT
jgi:hypothetical protein